jgi:cyanophycinase
MTETSQIPASQSVASGPAKGSLLVHGGGPIENDLGFLKLFSRLAGGDDASLVYIPTAASDEELAGKYRSHLDPAAVAHQLGFANVKILHTRDRRKADSRFFVRPLRKATAVFMTGGRQWRLADAYLNTRTQQKIEQVLERGGVVAGSSAGATIQGSLLIRGNSDPDDPNILLGDHQQGFGFLKNIAIDQHLSKRGREADLPQVLERHPEVLGIGIDEDTSILVQGDGFQVIGKGCVIVHDGSAPPQSPVTSKLQDTVTYNLLERKFTYQLV